MFEPDLYRKSRSNEHLPRSFRHHAELDVGCAIAIYSQGLITERKNNKMDAIDTRVQLNWKKNFNLSMSVKWFNYSILHLLLKKILWRLHEKCNEIVKTRKKYYFQNVQSGSLFLLEKILRLRNYWLSNAWKIPETIVKMLRLLPSSSSGKTLYLTNEMEL